MQKAEGTLGKTKNGLHVLHFYDQNGVYRGLSFRFLLALALVGGGRGCFLPTPPTYRRKNSYCFLPCVVL